MTEKFTHVKLVYFKESGKYYSEGELDIPRSSSGYDVPFYEAIAHVREMLERGERPGLYSWSLVNDYDFHTLVTVFTEHGPLSHLFTRGINGNLTRTAGSPYGRRQDLGSRDENGNLRTASERWPDGTPT